MVKHRYLVTGGAGFVGSHMVAALLERGDDVVVLDNLSTGHRAAVLAPARLLVADLADAAAVDAILADGPFHAVLHFASLSVVGESMQFPFRYLLENAATGIRLIEACVRHGVRRFVLSSTANLFGQAGTEFIDETTPVQPHSPYGESKHMLERALFWADQVHGLRSACLRFFNAAGADPSGILGEDHSPETHVIPLAIDAALGRRDGFTIFGHDYPTPDGTCIRDYIHVADLATAHMAALAQLDSASVSYNLGNGQGYSVRQVIAAVEDITGRRVPTMPGARRPGDPARLVASSARIAAQTGWRPRHDSLRKIVETAAAWRQAHPHGFDDRRD